MSKTLQQPPKLYTLSQQMRGRVFVLIFFFWAILTIITPTLILLSESSKTDLDLRGYMTEGMKARKMMADFEKHLDTLITPPPFKPSAPAPAPTPESASRIEKLYQKQ
ncbi:hypothetical protein CFOL_v3_09167 [Cephalotus follicularis]|uniref:Uncharacterized protein n=1 Tax=Cephalotus follicularis TaxID=3775 RepID=A0A1Q3BCY5_CEPFO|nr:hypothetical protein CFOL_v3_09167 [Cephalotus follicularis]